MKGNIVIVGNRFKTFALQNESVMTKSDFFEQLESNNIEHLNGYGILIGQGVSPEDIRRIKTKVDGTKIHGFTDLVLSKESENEHQKMVHKHKKDNIMITPPYRVGQFSYFSSLHLRDDCAELSDHMTGQHIQGINLIEGARQLMLSVSEMFLLAPELKLKSYFVLNNIESEFKKFVFPLEISMLFHLKNIETKKMGSISAESECEFTQNGEHVATIKMTFSTYAQEFISKKEELLASSCCQSLFKNKGTMLEKNYAS